MLFQYISLSTGIGGELLDQSGFGESTSNSQPQIEDALKARPYLASNAFV